MRVLKEGAQTSWSWVTLPAVAIIVAVAWLDVSRGSTDPEKLWEEAESALNKGAIDHAETALARLKKLREPNVYDRILRAQVAMARGQVDAALADLATVPDDHRMAPQARMFAGRLELRRGRPHAAEKYHKAALKLDPTLQIAHRELIYIYGTLQDRAGSNAEFLALSKLVHLTYDDVWKWCLLRTNKWEQQERTEQLEGFIKVDPEDRLSRMALAENYRTLGRRDDAKHVLEYLGDADADARALKAELALDVGDDLTAESLLKEGPADHPALARLRGRFALAHHDGPTAVKMYQIAFHADPDNRDSIFGLGQAYRLVGDEKAAGPFIEAAKNHDIFASLMQRAAVRENRKDPALLRALGAASERIHRIPEARAWYGLALDLDATDADAQKALFRLRASDSGDMPAQGVKGSEDPKQTAKLPSATSP